MGDGGAEEALFLAFVDDGDAVGQDDEGDGVLVEGEVGCEGGEARVIVVFDKGA